MAKTVFILGAGASKHAGAPLINEFLERAWGLLATGGLDDAARRDFELVRKGINELQLAHSKGDLDIWNLEAVFDAFEMAALVRRLGDLGEEDVKRLPEVMRTVILETLQREIAFPLTLPTKPPITVPGGSEKGDILPGPTEAYRQFVAEIVRRHKDTEPYPAVITFNYDLCLELALHFESCKWTYCLSDSESNERLKVLKLHGSLNWAFCPSCNAVGVSRDMHDILRTASEDATRANNEHQPYTRMIVATGSPRVSGCKCEQSNPEVMLVPPTINKGSYHAVLSEVWAAAAAELSSADEIFVCGYSLPETDAFFRYLYAVGTIGEASLRRVWVFNPDPGIKPRFEKLLGKQVLGAQDGFLLFPLTFEDDRRRKHNINWPVVLDHDLSNLPEPL